VKRASELIAVCREKINTAKLEVEKVVADLNAD
jgi:exonuclease VII small subunit